MTYTGETLTLFLLPTATLIILLTQQCCNLTINYSACSSFQHDRHTFIIMHLRVSCNPTWIKEQTRNNEDCRYWFLFDELHHLSFLFWRYKKNLYNSPHLQQGYFCFTHCHTFWDRLSRYHKPFTLVMKWLSIVKW